MLDLQISEFDLEEETEKVLLQEVVADCLAQLSPLQRSVVIWRFYGGLSFQGIGEQMGFSASRARDLLASAIRRLRHPRLSRELKPFC